MRLFRNGWLTALVIGALWCAVLAITAAVIMAFGSGAAVRPVIWIALVAGGLSGLAVAGLPGVTGRLLAMALVATTILAGSGPMAFASGTEWAPRLVGAALLAAPFGWTLGTILRGIGLARIDRHDYEHAMIRGLTGFGYIFFTAIVAVPFYVMLLSSLKNEAELRLNPLDLSIDLSRGWEMFGAYVELFTTNNFGTYLLNSTIVSVATVIITLLFAVPGAYSVARLRFRGQAALSRSILLIYMVPMIVLALPIYVAFAMVGLRNTLVGIILIYPVTTIPVALYMLQGYFRGLPFEIEEAGLMDGLSRLQVIWKITLPLSLPAMVSVSLYVFMIAWNEFLLALMLLDDPGRFTLPRGVYQLNSSEVARQNLMAGAVIATVPILVLFLTLERFMTKGLTAGSVKG